LTWIWRGSGTDVAESLRSSALERNRELCTVHAHDDALKPAASSVREVYVVAPIRRHRDRSIIADRIRRRVVLRRGQPVYVSFHSDSPVNISDTTYLTLSHHQHFSSDRTPSRAATVTAASESIASRERRLHHAALAALLREEDSDVLVAAARRAAPLLGWLVIEEQPRK